MTKQPKTLQPESVRFCRNPLDTLSKTLTIFRFNFRFNFCVKNLAYNVQTLAHFALRKSPQTRIKSTKNPGKPCLSWPPGKVQEEGLEPSEKPLQPAKNQHSCIFISTFVSTPVRFPANYITHNAKKRPPTHTNRESPLTGRKRYRDPLDHATL